MTKPTDTPSLLARLIAAGTPADLVGEVALLIAKSHLLEERKANDRERKERQREAATGHVKSREVTGQPGQAVTSASHASTRAEPETNNSSENKERKEGRKEEPPAAAPSPKPSKTLCPSEFEPSAKALDLGVSLGLDRAAVFEARDTMVAWSRGNGEKRLDWDAVFGNWLRRDAKDRAKARGSPPRGQAANDAAMMALNRAAHQRLLELDDDDAWQQTALGPPG